MATQGMVSVTKNGATAIKIIAGCNGYNAPLVGEAVRRLERIPTIEEAFEIATEHSFGSESCLVVMDGTRHIFESDEALPDRYRETFDDPRFNPRWDSGEVEYLEVIEM